ncbi:MAG: hypothetical protein ACR2O4_12525, partial [Hyphomicrobiaceae bacterium]
GNVVASAARIARRTRNAQMATIQPPGDNALKTEIGSASGTDRNSETTAKTGTTGVVGGTEKPQAGAKTSAEDKSRLAKRKAKRRAAARRIAAAKRRARNRARYRARQRAQHRVRNRRTRTVSRRVRSRRIIRLTDNPPIDVRVTRLNNSFRSQARGFGASRYIRRWRP